MVERAAAGGARTRVPTVDPPADPSACRRRNHALAAFQMFVGHFAAGFGAKAIHPKASLGTLFFAAQFVDLLWPFLLLIGMEHVEIAPGITEVTPLDFVSYPISHSLAAVLAWAIVVGGFYGAARRSLRGAAVIGLLVVSHWVLDAIVHRPDLRLYPGSSTLVGFGLWNSVAATLAVELGLLAIGLGFYLRVTAATDRIGSLALWGLVAFLLVISAANMFGPPPPTESAIAWAGHLQWLLVVWAFWVDRHRVARPTDRPASGSRTGASSSA